MHTTSSETGSYPGDPATGRSLMTSERAAMIVVVAIAVIARLAFGLLKFQNQPADPDQYLAIADSLIHGQGFSFQGRLTAYRPPLYPILLAPIVGIFGQGKAFHAVLILFQSAIGGATAWLTVRERSRYAHFRRALRTRAERRIAGGVIVSSFAGAAVALDPLLLSQAPLVMTETLATCLLTAAVSSLLKGRPKSAGFWFGAASLCRPSLLACLGLTLFARIAAPSVSPLVVRVREAAVMLACCVAVVAPWTYRNWQVFGEPVVTTTHGGYTLALANNAVYYEDVVFGPPNAVWTGPRQQAWMDTIGTDTIGLSEPEADRKIRAKATAFIKSHPREFFISCIHRQLRFWAIAPSGEVYGAKVRMLCISWTLPLFILACAALCGRSTWSWPIVATIAVASGLAIVHLFYWTDIRMRAPIVPTLAILAAQGLSMTRRFIER